MKGHVNSEYGEVIISPDVIATYAGSVAVEESAVKFKVNTVEASKIDLSNWNGTPADVATATSGWTLKAGETIETGELAKADLSGLKADETKTILTASDTVVFTNDAITGKKKWKEGPYSWQRKRKT